MKRSAVSLLGGLALLAAVASAVTPAFALGGCGPNRHRNFRGFCVFGGQNENYCVRRTGHPAGRMPNGNVRCF